MMDEAKTVFKKFSRTTTIQGFRYIERTRRETRVNWIILTSTVVTVCLCKCWINLETYLAFDVKTKITTSPSKSVDFPAITFCPEYTYKRSGISNLMNKEIMLAFLMAKSDNHMERLVKEVCKCYIVLVNYTTPVLYCTAYILTVNT